MLCKQPELEIRFSSDPYFSCSAHVKYIKYVSEPVHVCLCFYEYLRFSMVAQNTLVKSTDQQSH